MPNKDYSSVGWRYDEKDSAWNNTVNLIKATGYEPRNVSMDSFAACILLHYEGECEREYREIPLQEYLECGIMHGEAGRLEDFDYD